MVTEVNSKTLENDAATSPFQWALEIENLLDKQKPKHDLDDMRTWGRYIE